MKKKEKRIDPIFDGHLEKPFSKLTPREKIYYLWLQMEFHYAIRNRKLLSNDSTNQQNKR
jgi:hypothetical protein